MMTKKLLLIGGGGHCKSVLDSLLAGNGFSEIGIIDLPENVGQEIFGSFVIGDDDDLQELFASGYKNAFVTVGSVGDPSIRIGLFRVLEAIGFQIPNIIDPSAVVSRHVVMDKGIFVGKNAVVNAGSTIGRGAIINTRSAVEHDCVVGAFVHLAPGSILGGNVRVGENTHVGMGSIVKQQITIGSNAIIGMGSVVLDNIVENTVSYGNPCKVVRER